jgi:hypothetical protein
VGKRRSAWKLLGTITIVASLLTVTGAVQNEEPISVIINEVEINPPGLDSGNEWIEILNLSAQPVDLFGWTVSYVYRGPGTVPVAEESIILGPDERFVFVYPRLALRNAQANVIRLIDPAGLVVDETSPLTDTADDESTWQRFPDGGDPWFPDLWLFLPATRGRTND